MEKNIEKFKNKVFNIDIIKLLKKLPNNSIDMIYGDPDYNVNIKYEGKSYTTKWDDYIDWYIKLSTECIRVLKNDGNMFMINYPKQNSYLRVKYLDNICYDVHDYVWAYNTNVGHSKKKFTTAHRSILHCRKIKDSKFYKDHVAMPYKNQNDKRILGRIKNGSKGVMPYSWFYFNLVKNVSKEKTAHACQIPQELSEMLIKSCTLEEDTALILFGGSGSEVAVCIDNDRNFITAELDKTYCKIIKQRIKDAKAKEKFVDIFNI